MKDYILTCDVGTTGTKCSVFDREGTAVAAAYTPNSTQYPRPGWAEQNTDEYLSAFVRGVKELLIQVNPARIACIGLSGTMNGCIPVGTLGDALSPNIIHSDARAEGMCRTIRECISDAEFYALTGNKLDAHYTLPKILWMRENYPEIYKKTAWWLNTKDYLYGFLTGKYGYTDYSDASLTTALDINKRKWATGLLKELNIKASSMPKILPSHDVSGALTKKVADLTGLIEGTPVAIGAGDGASATRGAGIYDSHQAYCCIGSSAWVALLTDQPMLDKRERTFNFLDMDGKKNITCGTVQCGSAAYDWALSNLLMPGVALTPAAFYEVENLARQAQPGAEGVLFLPTLMGERTPYWNPNTRGCLVGYTLYHDRRHIARAVYEGVAFALKTCADVMADNGEPVTSLVLTGGGARSGLWPDIIASVFNIETRVHAAPSESTSLGSAIAAGVGVGLFKSYTEAASIAHTRSHHSPNPAAVAEYQRAFPIYNALYEQLVPIFDSLAANAN